jgi:hypothetical protein
VGGSTVNHAWTGGPLTLLSKYVAGIAPTEPGYAAFQVLPQLGDLTEVSASVPSIKGTISVDIERGPPFTMNVVVPPDAPAVVGIPVAAVTSLGSARIEITLGGTVIFSAGSFRAKPDVSFVGTDGGYVKFGVAGGSHAFSAREL